MKKHILLLFLFGFIFSITDAKIEANFPSNEYSSNAHKKSPQTKSHFKIKDWIKSKLKPKKKKWNASFVILLISVLFFIVSMTLLIVIISSFRTMAMTVLGLLIGCIVGLVALVFLFGAIYGIWLGIYYW